MSQDVSEYKTIHYQQSPTWQNNNLEAHYRVFPMSTSGMLPITHSGISSLQENLESPGPQPDPITRESEKMAM